MADDHAMVLAGIGKLLENDCDLIGAVGDGHALLRAVQQQRPDVVLLDISMPLLNGIDTCRQLVKSIPKARVIFLTMHAEVAYIEEAFRAGAAGYLLKRSAASELKDAIKVVMRGGRYVTRLIDWKQSCTGKNQTGGKIGEAESLTQRQREVLQLVAEGRANKEIAVLLHVSEKTIDYHKSAIKRELMLASTAELTRFAIKHHIIGI
ncbi:MAG: response regulator transcription factor [Acidobacteriota bacterium]|nr:response regulator transcription factor [Acidobacteriota bacterium]